MSLHARLLHPARAARLTSALLGCAPAALLTSALLGCTPTAAPRAEPPRVEPLGKPANPAALAIDGSQPHRIVKAWEVNLGGRGVAVAVSRSASRVAAAVADSPVKLYDTRTGKALGASASCTDVLRSGVYLAASRLIVACGSRVEQYQLRDLKELSRLEFEPEQRAVAVTLSWPWLAVGHHDGVLRIYDLVGGGVREIEVPGPPIDVKSLALSHDGQRLAVAWVQGSIWWWSIDAPEQPNRLVRYENESDALAFDRSGRLLAEEGEANLTRVWALDEAKPAHLRAHGAWIKSLWFTARGDWLVRGGSHGLDLVELAGEGTLSLANGLVEDVALDDDGASLAAVDREGNLRLWVGRP